MRRRGGPTVHHRVSTPVRGDRGGVHKKDYRGRPQLFEQRLIKWTDNTQSEPIAHSLSGPTETHAERNSAQQSPWKCTDHCPVAIRELGDEVIARDTEAGRGVAPKEGQQPTCDEPLCASGHPDSMRTAATRDPRGHPRGQLLQCRIVHPEAAWQELT